MLIPALAVFAPLYAQAYGNLIVPALLLFIGLAVRLRSSRFQVDADQEANAYTFNRGWTSRQVRI